MGKYISDESRYKLKRGSGTGIDYKTWIKDRDFCNMGVSAMVIDFKTGRPVYLLSQGELWWYYIFRWNDDVVDIQEQYPLLPIEDTVAIAEEMGIAPVKDVKKRNKVMTTDMLLTMVDGSQKAVSVKLDRKAVDDRRTQQNLIVESEYWIRQGIPWIQVYKEDLNPTLVSNIERVWNSWDEDRVYDDFSLARYLIIHKVITVDMTKEIDYRELIAKLKKDAIWDEYSYLLKE